MADSENDGAWFGPRSFGYGAGWPVAWQGWAMLGGYAALLIACVALAKWNKPVGADIGASVLAVATVALVLISKRRTRGGWRWRWGRDS